MILGLERVMIGKNMRDVHIQDTNPVKIPKTQTFFEISQAFGHDHHKIVFFVTVWDE